jgi:hypothetical protein
MPYRRRGVGDSNINATTIWTPQTGFNVSGGGGAGPAVFVAPTTVPVPACSQDTQPGGAAFSDACIAQVLAAQQQNMQLRNNANYNVDLQNCLNTYPQPPDCYSRTFGLTPTGGYTSDAGAGPGGSTLILDASGNPVGSPPSVAAPAPAPYVAAPSATPVAAPVSSTPAGSPVPSPAGAPSSYVTAGTDFLSGSVGIAGSSFPVWGLLAAGAALLLFMGGKH